jgi:hypothetical protein
VELLLRDQQVTGGGPVRDHHRQALLDAATLRYGSGQWFTIMHGDEIFHDSPRSVAAAAEAQGAHRVNWAVMQFFLHPEDDPDPTRPVQERVRWYSPFWVEIRQFKSGPNTRYRKRHGTVLPDGVGWRTFNRMPLLKHYPYRSPEQMRTRLAHMRDRGFSGTPVHEAIHRTHYAPEYRRAQRFEEDFGKLEMAHQGGLLRMTWRWKRWVRQG